MKKLITSICMVLCLAFTYSNTQAQICQTPQNFIISSESGSNFTHQWDVVSGSIGYEFYVRDLNGTLLATHSISGNTNNSYVLDVSPYSGTIRTTVAADCGFGNVSNPSLPRTIATVADVIRNAVDPCLHSNDPGSDSDVVQDKTTGDTYSLNCMCEEIPALEAFFDEVNPRHGIICSNMHIANSWVDYWSGYLCTCPDESEGFDEFYGELNQGATKYLPALYNSGELETLMCVSLCMSSCTSMLCPKEERSFGGNIEGYESSYGLINSYTSSQITFNVANETGIQASMYSANGQRVVTIVDDVIKPEGTYQYTIDPSGLITGIYIIQIKIGNEISHEKLFIK